MAKREMWYNWDEVERWAVDGQMVTNNITPVMAV